MRFLILIFIITNVYANETLIIFCDQNAPTIEIVNSLKKFATVTDKVFEAGNGCAEILTSNLKEELFTKIMKLKYPNINIQSTNQPSSSGQTCKLNIDQIKNGKLEQNNFDLNKNINLGQLNNTVQNIESSQILVSNNQTANFQVDNNQYTLKCRIINQDQYEITINSQAQTNSIATSLIISRGQRIEIASQLKNTQGNTKDIGFPNGINLNNQKGQSLTSVYLSVQ